MFGGFNSSKCKNQCRMCISRIKLLRNKRSLQIKAMRKEVAELLRQGKNEYARIRVEAVMREDMTAQAFEILELFLELVNVRVQLLEKAKDMPPDMCEAVASIVYAAERLSNDLPELREIMKMMASKFGKEYIVSVTQAGLSVNERLRACLSVEPPPAEDKLEVLIQIATEAGIEIDDQKLAHEMLPRYRNQQTFNAGTGPYFEPAAVESLDGTGGPARFAKINSGRSVAPSAPSAPGPYSTVPPRMRDPELSGATTSATSAPDRKTSGLTRFPLGPGLSDDDEEEDDKAAAAAIPHAVRPNAAPQPPPFTAPDPSAPIAGQYTDAIAAATAAMQAAERAQNAAEQAHQLAHRTQPGDGGARPGGKSQQQLQDEYDAAPGPPAKPTVATVTDVAKPDASAALPAPPSGPVIPAPPSGPVIPSAPKDAAPGFFAPPSVAQSTNELDDLQKRFDALRRR